jgi:glutamate/tyrosine decarboxylase-like PLP-dependent enzyme
LKNFLFFFPKLLLDKHSKDNSDFAFMSLPHLSSLLLPPLCSSYSSLPSFPVVPPVLPSFLRARLPTSLPEEGIEEEEIIKETFDNIFSGLTHWQHPSFFAYYPSSMGHSTILAEMWSVAFGSKGGKWEQGPSQFEVEKVVGNWIRKILSLPEKFENNAVICTSVTHGYFESVHIAKHKKLSSLSSSSSSPLKFKLVAYFSEPAFAWSDKALRLKEIVHTRKLPVYYDSSKGNYSINYENFESIIKKDIADGLIPFWCAATLGYTATCGCDDLEKMGQICKKFDIFLLTDAAYLCSYMALPEFNEKWKGIENVDCLLVNHSKNWLIANVGTFMFLGESQSIQNAFQSFEETNKLQGDSFENWGTGYSHKWNSLKLYFLIKTLGVEGLREYFRRYIDLSKHLEERMSVDKRFQVICRREFGILVFKVESPVMKEGEEESMEVKNETQRKFYKICLRDTRKGYFSLSHIGEEEVVRISIGNPSTGEKEIEMLWEHLRGCCDVLYDQK